MYSPLNPVGVPLVDLKLLAVGSDRILHRGFQRF